MVLFSGLVWTQTSLGDENFGYVIHESLALQNILCTTDPMPGECNAFKDDVAFTEKTQSLTGAALAQLKMALNGTNYTSTESCVDYFCKMGFPHTCEEGYIAQDIAGVKKSCKKAEKYCINVTGGQPFIIHAFINCSMSMPEAIKRRIIQCSHFPDVKDDPYTCAKRNYKVFSRNLTEQARTQVALHEMLVTYASNTSQECLNDVSEVICKTIAPACDRNETTIVSLLSKQECERITSCLNDTSNGQNMAEEHAKMCTELPDEKTAKKIPLSLVYTAFEHNTVPNNTKINTTLITKWLVPSKTAYSQHPNTTGESYSPNTSTKEPYLNSTGEITGTKRAILLSKSTPMTQANLTKTNTKAEVTTEKQIMNTTSGVKSAASLKPTTESVLNQNYTSQDQLSPKLAKTSSPDVAGHVNATANRPVVNTTDIFNVTITHPSLPVSVNSQDQPSTKLTRTPQLNATSSPNVGYVNATASRPVVNVTFVFNVTVTRPSLSASANCSNSTNANCNKAPNKKMNALVVLVISTLSIWMWQ